MEYIHNCGNCAHFEACLFIMSRYCDEVKSKDAQACGNYAYKLEDILGDDYDLGRLKELVEADRDGRAIISPVKLYQTVLFARNPDREPDNVVETTVQKIICKNNGGVYMKLSCNAMYETSCNSIGKTVFLTPGAAEAALKGES